MMKKGRLQCNFGDQVTVNMDLGSEKSIEEVELPETLKTKSETWVLLLPFLQKISEYFR
jgi:hypothetical protein